MADPDFAAWAKTRPWWRAAYALILAGTRCVSVRDAEMPPWPNSVVISIPHYSGNIVVSRRRVGWGLTVRSAWENRSHDQS